MKATGIIRRIDDLGRVVIPKEIRRTMNIREGDPFEIFIDKEAKTVCFTKYYERNICDEGIIDTALDMAKASNITIAIYTEHYKIASSFPSNVVFSSTTPDEWRDERKPFKTDELLVVPVVCEGEVFGYVASERINIVDLEVIMIARYITVALSQIV